MPLHVFTGKQQDGAGGGGGGILVWSGGISAPVIPPFPVQLLDPILQRLNVSTGSETSVTLVATRTGTLQKLKVLVLSNTMTVPVTVTLRVNAVDTAVLTVIPAGVTGTFTSGALSAPISEDDLLSVGLSQVGEGAGVAILVNATNELV